MYPAEQQVKNCCITSLVLIYELEVIARQAQSGSTMHRNRGDTVPIPTTAPLHSCIFATTPGLIKVLWSN